MTLSPFSLGGLSALAMSLLIGATAFGQTVATVPVGAVTVTVAAGTGTNRTLSVISIPLLIGSNITGQTTGVITGLTSTTVSNSNAGWLAGQLSAIAAPYLLRITSGSASGKTFLISTGSANTANQLSLDSSEGVDLTSLGIVVGQDTYEIIPADTISAVFGTPASSGVLGGSTPILADTVFLFKNGGWRQYFYNTTNGHNRWEQNTLGNPDASNEVIRPDGAILYSRLANTGLSLTVTGNVPRTLRSATVANSGLTFLSAGWPVDSTLVASGIQNLPGWTSSSSPNLADGVLVLGPSGWLQFYYDGSDWRQNTLGSPIKNTQIVSAGAGFLINKKGATSGSNVLIQQIPYSL